MSKKRVYFTKEFKLEALRLAEDSDTCVAELARDLGIRRNMIYKWRCQLQKNGDKAFKNTATAKNTSIYEGRQTELVKENERLEKELKLAKLEVEILKKAQAYFKKAKN
ncbi:MAG: Unknown protein [uncultured Campylobacterales bacterium]|uniref:Transposase n=1 Tax=uncultured Campylobacterales bacterium TaxID=352960 RepID=A0A6S6T0B1_9BACT|nr:MAG: Unknown protein [uncultured Campylobacterales bacterium]